MKKQKKLSNSTQSLHIGDLISHIQLYITGKMSSITWNQIIVWLKKIDLSSKLCLTAHFLMLSNIELKKNILVLNMFLSRFWE